MPGTTQQPTRPTVRPFSAMHTHSVEGQGSKQETHSKRLPSVWVLGLKAPALGKAVLKKGGCENGRSRMEVSNLQRSRPPPENHEAIENTSPFFVLEMSGKLNVMNPEVGKKLHVGHAFPRKLGQALRSTLLHHRNCESANACQ